MATALVGAGRLITKQKTIGAAGLWAAPPFHGAKAMDKLIKTTPRDRMTEGEFAKLRDLVGELLSDIAKAIV